MANRKQRDRATHQGYVVRVSWLAGTVSVISALYFRKDTIGQEILQQFGSGPKDIAHAKRGLGLTETAPGLMICVSKSLLASSRSR
jgi:hypothetical protein